MKKISYYLVLAVIAGGLITSFWVYQKYFKDESAKILPFTVERGEIKEAVRVRGEAVAQKEFDLEFPLSGIIKNVFVKEGQSVIAGAPLMQLNTKDFEIEMSRWKSILTQRKLNLDKILAGATEEDINISETKVRNSQIALNEAKKNLMDKIQDAYTKSDDAVRGKIDQFLNNARSINPTLIFFISDSQLQSDVEWGRFLTEGVLNAWQVSLGKLSSSGDPMVYTAKTRDNLNNIKIFVDKAALAVNGAVSGTSLSQSTIDAWQTGVSSARTNLNVAIVNFAAAEEKFKAAQSNLALAEDELSLKQSGAREEDIGIARAQINEIENQIAMTQEKIKKSFLWAPAPVKVTKIWVEAGEFFMPGQTAISLSSPNYKIQADVSELEIGKIMVLNDSDVAILFDAFPDVKFKGKVISIDSKEIIKDGDTYYRVSIYLEKGGAEIRSGMSADLVINISQKESVLKIPEFVVYQKEGKDFVIVVQSGKQTEVSVETGISDGEYVEIIKGLSEGQTVAVLAE